MKSSKSNILIVGHGVAAHALARKFRSYDKVGKIFITQQTNVNSEDFVNIDIREDDLTNLLKFALENDVKLSIPIGQKAISSDIVTFFESNGQNIFGPSKRASHFLYNKVYQNKFLYKIKAPVPRFGLFNKIQLASEYLKNSTYPQVLRGVNYSELNDNLLVCNCEKSARNFFEDLLNSGETDILIEDFVYGVPATVYYITDGYGFLPITSTYMYKFLNDDMSKYVSSGVGCYAPNYNVNNEIMNKLGEYIGIILKSLEDKGSTYCGVLGVDIVITSENDFVITGMKPFFENTDASAILNLCEQNLYELFMSCVNGFFSDEYTEIKTNDYYSASAVVFSASTDIRLNLGDYIDNIDFINIKIQNNECLTKKGASFILTFTNSTLTSARNKLKECLNDIKFSGIKYRKDICETQKRY